MKKLGLVLLGLVLSSFLIASVSAADASEAFKPIADMITGLVKTIYTTIEPIVKFIVGDTGGDAGIFLAKFLLLLLLLAMVSGILKASGVAFLSNSDSWSHWVISGVTAILGIYFLTPDLVRTILIPNTTLGVVITGALPFLIYFWFVEKSMGNANGTPAIIRRIAWIAYAVVFLSVWMLNYEQITAPIVATIYPTIFILCLVMAAVDGTIQGFFNRVAAAKLAQSAVTVQISRHRVNLQNLKQAITNNTYVPGATMTTLGYDAASYPGYTFSVAGDTVAAGSLKDIRAIERIINSL